MESKTYELPFDRETGRHRKETIVADVVKRGEETPCPLESAEIQFPEELFELQMELEAGAQEVRADVTLRDEVYTGSDFGTIIEKDYTFVLHVVPRELTPDGGYKLGPALSGTCTVRCEPVPPALTLKQPGEDELPLPAVGDLATELVLQVTMGAGGRPWPGLELRWERVEGGASGRGTLEGASTVTDSNGEIRLTYTAPRLHYKPGNQFFEEYRFLGTGKDQRELFRLKIPLAPFIAFRLKAEKVQELDGEKYGIEGQLTEVVEIDPRERAKTLEGALELETAVQGETRRFPVANMECAVLLGDENGVPENQEGVRLKTDSEGKIRWEIPELVEAFGKRGRSYELDSGRSELPVLKLAEATQKALEYYETRFDNPAFPRGVFQGGLEEELRKYRFVHTEQLASRAPAAYEKIRDTMETLGIATRYAGPFHRCHTEQFSPLLGVLGDTFWDFFNYVWNLKDMAGIIIGKLSSGASAIAQAIASRCQGSVAFLRGLLARMRPLQWAVGKVAGFVEWLATKVTGLAAFAAETAGKLRKAALAMAKDATELYNLLGNIESKGVRLVGGFVVALKGFVANLGHAIGFVLNGVVGVLERFGFWLMSRAAAGLRLFEQTFFKYLEGSAGMEAVHRGIEYFMKAIELHWHGKLAVEGTLVQVGNYIQSILEGFFGKGSGIQGGVSGRVSSFATMNLFDPAATVAVRELHGACAHLGVSGDPKEKLRVTRGMASHVAQVQLTYEKSFIVGEAIKMFVDSMKIPVQVAIAAVVTLTTLGGGTVAVGAICTKMELAISTIAICLLDVPHAVTIFLGSMFIQQAYLTAVANLGA